MASQTVYINRRKYAVGLFWQPAGVGLSGRNYARVLAHNIDKKLNLYTEYHSMIGLGGRKYGHKPTMRVAAAEVMEAFSEYMSFLAVFEVGKQFYLVAARNGVVLEDKLFENEDDARNAYVKLSEIPDWGAFFAPGSWGMPRSVERNLADVLVGRENVQLHLISHFSAGVFSVLLIALFMLGFGIIFHDSLNQTLRSRPNVAELDPELVQEYKRQIEEKNKELDKQFDIQKQLPPPPIVMPYEKLPAPDARAELCYKAIGFLMQPLSGWNQVRVECNESNAVMELQRDFGTLDEFYSVAGDIMPGVFVQEINENLLRVQAKLPQLENFASQDERDAQTIVRDITSLFQGINTDVELKIVTDTLTNGVDVANVDVVEIAAESKLIPQQFMQIFDDFGGVYLMKCTWDAATRFWNYEVIIYAK